VLLGLFEQFVELPLQYFLMVLVLFKRLLKHFATPGLFALHLLYGCANVLNGWRLVMLFKTDHRLELRVNPQRRFAARAAHFYQLAFAFGHIPDTNLTVPLA